MEIRRSIDIEDEIRIALEGHIAAYCRPLPKKYRLPCVLITQVGGTDEDRQIDRFDVTLDARAKSAAEANEALRNAIGILRKVAAEQTTAIRHINVNTSGSWGNDPVRPDLEMCTARIRVIAHLETTEI